MGNALRGSVEVDIGGERHTIRFPIAALTEIKELFKAKSIADVFAQKEMLSDPESIVAMLAIGLKRGTMPDATPEKIAEIILVSDLTSCAEAVAAAFGSSSHGGTKQPAAEAGAELDPRKSEPPSTK